MGFFNWGPWQWGKVEGRGHPLCRWTVPTVTKDQVDRCLRTLLLGWISSSLGKDFGCSWLTLTLGFLPPRVLSWLQAPGLQKALASGLLSVPQLPAPRPSFTAAILPLLLLLTPPSLHIWVWRHSAEVVTHPGGMFTLCLCEPFAWGHCQGLSPQDTAHWPLLLPRLPTLHKAALTL